MLSQGYQSIPTRFDRLSRSLLQQCAVYKVYVPPDLIDYYLPDRLVGYAANTRINFIRRRFFFSRKVQSSTRSQFDDYIDQNSNWVPLDYFLHQVSRENNSLVRYNFVLLDDYLIFARVPYLLEKPHRPLSKHITISSRARTVRFAGEIWANGDNQFVVNNNSGTYRPVDELLPPAVQIFKDLTPNAHFQGASFRISALPPLAQRF